MIWVRITYFMIEDIEIQKLDYEKNSHRDLRRPEEEMFNILILISETS